MELRQVLEDVPELMVVWVMAERQINERSLRLIDEAGLRERVLFLSDPESAAIERLGLLKRDPEPIEEGVPHPATYVLDRDGVVRFVDVREDFHRWLDPQLVVDALP